MNEQWNTLVVKDVSFAMYVHAATGGRVHKNRPYHGFVLNDMGVERDYLFDDGYVLHTKGGDLFYLPKGSSYCVKGSGYGGCYAINFQADIIDLPFTVDLRSTESLLRNFRAAADAWKSNDLTARALTMRAVYDAVYRVQKESQRRYVSGSQVMLISPAIDKINQSFNENDISVSSLASMCGISEVYFRRLFLKAFGVSPKEYVIQKRIEYAKSLLCSESFSVMEVAALCGYSEPCHFSREFLKRVGISPSQYCK